MLVLHTSLVDTIAPTTFVTAKAGMPLRFVLERELLQDPCLAIAEHWLPNVFVDRAAADSAPALANIRALARQMDPHEGALIYLEGTLYSAAKLPRALEKLSASNPKSATQVMAMIVLMNLVFSFDSILSALAITKVFVVLALAIIGSCLGMLFAAGHVGHMKLFGYPIEPLSKTTFYFSIAVLVLVDIVQSKYRNKLETERARVART